MRRVVVIMGAALLLVSLSIKNRTSQDIPAPAVFRVLSSGSITVKISGEVLHSGIYEVPANALAESVINMAIPLCPLEQCKVSSSAVTPLHNGSAVKLSVQADGASLLKVDRMTVAEQMVLGIPLDISNMSEADFDCLPGIGPALAGRIVAYRQNNGGILHVNDLLGIKGIGEKKYHNLRTYFQHP
ncbi:MAG: helix-hairpin-helix domain-containing protein [Desulfuromonadaceae bacterium]|nr:helix-hairpin-helix domain-containing protein [Desulfuromonadaceae bacterium]